MDETVLSTNQDAQDPDQNVFVEVKKTVFAKN